MAQPLVRFIDCTTIVGEQGKSGLIDVGVRVETPSQALQRGQPIALMTILSGRSNMAQK